MSDDTANMVAHSRDGLETQLAEQKKAYDDFRQKSPLIWKGKDGINVQQERVAGIESRRSALMIRRAELQERLKTIEASIYLHRPRAELLALAAEPEPAEEGKEPAKSGDGQHTLADQLVALQLQEKQLLEDYGADHPQVKSVRRRIELLGDYIKHQAGTGVPTVLGLDGDARAADPVEVRLVQLWGQWEETRARLQSLKTLLDAEQEAGRADDV